MLGEPEVKRTMIQTAPTPVLNINYGSVSQDVPLMNPAFRLGRTSENDIVIPVKTVSRQHAILERTQQGYVIRDQNSTNGLIHNGQRIREKLLADGDMVRIWDDSGNMVTLTYIDPLRPAAHQIRALQLTPQMKTVTIGRAAGNTLVLNYPQVSASHAVIEHTPGGTVIRDLSSTNGTYVRGYRLHANQPMPINPGEIIYIAGYQLVYQGSTLEQIPTDSIRLDALNLTKKVNKGQLTLLDNISLSIQPREFVAIVGGSGAGKSTLMDALNGFRPAPEGRVLINGQDFYQNFAAYRHNLGYVPQDDIIHRDLSVERALYYAAKMRLPKDTSESELMQRVKEVLEDVEMSHRKDVVVSRLSGGQRKRVSIAVELLAKPGLLFLDEPTSGLDPGLDKRLMFLLRRLADAGRTIILITHATSNINVCDKVVFLAPGGRLAFYGAPREALSHFEVNEFADIYNLLEQSPGSSVEWEARFRQSRYFTQNIAHPLSEVAAPVQARQLFQGGTKTSGLRQFWILSRRYTELLLRDRVNLLVMILQAPIIGLVLALVAGDNIFADGKPPITTQRVLFILAVVAVWLGCANAAREITKENHIYLRERLVNLKIIPYIMSKVAVLSVLCLIQAVTLVGMIVLRSGTPPNGAFLPGWLELIIGAWLTTLGGMGMGLLVSALVSNTDKAGSLVPILLVPQIILAGLIFPLEGGAKVLSFATVSRWSIDSMGTAADLNRLYYQVVKSTPAGTQGVALSSPFDPENYDDYPSIDKDYSIGTYNETRRNHILKRWGTLAGMTMAFVVLAGIAQKRKDRAWSKR